MHRRYIDLPAGQLHLRDTSPALPGSAPPLLCLHPLPYSGLFFDTITPFLAGRRRILSPDYPGYGGSDHANGDCSIEQWAVALTQLLDALAIDEPVDLLAFHTGCLVGPALALLKPEAVRQLILVDVPWFEKQERMQLARSSAQPPLITAEITSLSGPWKTGVASKLAQVGPDRALTMLAEHLRPATRMNEGFGAAFAYDCEAQLPRVSQPCLVVGTASALRENSIAAAGAIPGAQFRDCPDIHPPAFETGAESLARLVLDFLET